MGQTDMKNEPQLHHSARRIVPGSLELLIEIFELLGCKIVYKQGNVRWAMISQNGINFNIQLVEVDETPIHNKSRISSHIAFISENPSDIIYKVEQWASNQNIRFTRGKWNEKELYFDLPDLFVDFVIEVMHKSVIEG